MDSQSEGFFGPSKSGLGYDEVGYTLSGRRLKQPVPPDEPVPAVREAPTVETKTDGDESASLEQDTPTLEASGFARPVVKRLSLDSPPRQVVKQAARSQTTTDKSPALTETGRYQRNNA